MKIINLFILALCLCLTMTEDDGDWVDPYKLPIDFPVHPFYAGYLPVSTQRSYFYVYHPSQSNPSKDPLVVRVSAGPGCSSLYSWLYSKGPFIFTPNTMDLRINPQNWNKQANVLFIEGPSGVGYSFDKSGTKTNITDQQFAKEMLQAIYAFYSKFPELKDQELYLTGQQYSGVTIPILAKLIVDKNIDRSTPIWQRIKLRGFLLENPCTMGDQCDSHNQFTPYTMQYLKNHYFISKQKYQEFLNHCTVSQTSEECLKMKHNIEAGFVNTGSDISNIYRECIKQTGPEKYKCMDTAGILAFMNNKDVREDIHVDQSATSWDLCNLELMEKYKRDPLGSLHIYEALLREQRDLRIWIVSGTLSASVPTVGTRRWFESLKNTLQRPTTRIWDAWKYDTDINAGQIEQFRGLTFLTVRSSGSKIYRDQPEIGYYIFNSFIKGKKL